MALITWTSFPVGAEDEPPPPEEKAEAAKAPTELEELIRELQKQIRELNEKIRQLSEEQQQEREEMQKQLRELKEQLRSEKKTREQDELEKILAEAEAETAGEAEKEKEAEKQREEFTGGQRNLQALNPEISFLGNFSYDWSDTDVRDQFLLRGVEIGFQAPLDPYTRFKSFIVAHQEPPEFGAVPGVDPDHGEEITVSIEEAYMEWIALPLHTRLRVGEFRQQFGTLNRWHPHALPSTDVPFALRNIFGEDGLIGIGFGVDWQLPGLWASSNGLTLEVTNADNPIAFAGSSFRDPAFLLRHTGFFDINPDTYLEIGLNGMIGENDGAGERETILGSLDLNFVWEPVQKARYRNFEIRGEFIHARFEQDDPMTGGKAVTKSNSFYTYLISRLSRRWILGLRYDDAELPFPRFELLDGMAFTEGLREKAWTPFLTFWQSEFVRLRLQYQHASRDFTWANGPDDDDRVWIQVTFAAGPHKHEFY
jgi:hypothetical protein